MYVAALARSEPMRQRRQINVDLEINTTSKGVQIKKNSVWHVYGRLFYLRLQHKQVNLKQLVDKLNDSKNIPLIIYKPKRVYN